MTARVLATFALSVALLATHTATSRAQEGPVSRADAASEQPPIRDNSFLVEEAYNQDAGTVQHINAFSRDATGDWAFSLTDEWAVRGQRHQLGATLPLSRVAGDSTSAWGLGDVAINYRYQIIGVDGGRVAAAPRLSVLVPTGDASRGLGAGVASVQVALPVSVALAPWLVAHLNAGVARVGARTAGGPVAVGATTTYSLGQSVVWLVTRRVNLLLESVFSATEQRNDAGDRIRQRELVVSPGIRWSHDLPHGLQIVPGIAVPVGVGPSRGDRSLFLYLSFEHPY